MACDDNRVGTFMLKCVCLTRNPESPLKPTPALPAARTNSWHFALFLGCVASWLTVRMLGLPFVLQMRRPQAEVIVIEIQHRDIKGSSQCSVFSLCVCVPLWGRHAQDSLTGLFLWLAEILRAVESAVMICIDFKGNGCPSLGLSCVPVHFFC